MQKLTSLLFVAIITITLIIEGLGLRGARFIIPYVFLLFPLLLGIISLEDPVKLPRSLALPFSVFVVFLFVSTLFSTDITLSVNQFFVLIGTLAAFILAYNYRKKEKAVLNIVIFASLFFVAYYFYSMLPFTNTLPQTNDGYNLVNPTFFKHNHLGDILSVFAVILLFYFLKGKFRIITATVVFLLLPLIFYSYSRSSYLSLAITSGALLVMYLRNKRITVNKNVMLLLLNAIVITTVFLFVSTKVSTNNLANSPQFAKPILNGREHYWSQALRTIKENPLLGVGPGAFINASKKYGAIPFVWVESSINIFLDMFSEGGVFLGLAFVVIIYLLIKGVDKTKLPFYVMLCLLINFQTDYTYRIYSLLLLFFVFAAYGYKKDKNEISISRKLTVTASLIAFMVLQLVFFSNLFYNKGYYSTALLLNPLNPSSYEQLLIENITRGDIQSTLKLLDKYKNLRKGNSSFRADIGRIYYGLGYKQEALKQYERAYSWFAFEGLTIYQDIYALKKELYGKREADKFIELHKQKVAQIEKGGPYSQQIENISY
jgi:O-antigen ligase